MNAVAQLPTSYNQTTKPLLRDGLAAKYGLKPDEFSLTVRATCGLTKATAEEFAAFLIVAKEYGLNPIIKEIYAFPAKGGGIVPIVSIDGWVNLVNSHPACDGFDIEFTDDDKGEPISCTCRMYRKDRSRPVVVTEYYEECKRNTDPWKMKHRMLRHKAMIQAARYAFGFSGIYDEDEGAKIADAPVSRSVNLTPPSPPSPPSPSSISSESNHIDAMEDAQVVETEEFNLEAFLTELDDAMATGKTEDAISEIWDGYDVEATLTDDEDALQRAFDLRKHRVARVLRTMLNSHPVNAG
ncbi:recombinase RecT [Brucellaceae bacterium D45D]